MRLCEVNRRRSPAGGGRRAAVALATRAVLAIPEDENEAAGPVCMVTLPDVGRETYHSTYKTVFREEVLYAFKE